MKNNYLGQDPKEPALNVAKGLLCDQKCFPSMDFLHLSRLCFAEKTFEVKSLHKKQEYLPRRNTKYHKGNQVFSILLSFVPLRPFVVKGLLFWFVRVRVCVCRGVEQ
jgi:hypothetical protein